MTRRPNGFTVIELLITIAVAAILMAIAVPSLMQVVRNLELTSITNTLLASINGARSEAMKRGGVAMVVPVKNGSGDTWANGWYVFVDGKERDELFDTTKDPSDKQVFWQEPLRPYFSIEGNHTAKDDPAYILFDPSGYLNKKDRTFGEVTSLTLRRNDVTGSPTAKCREVRSIVIERTGRSRSCTPKSNTDPACPVAGTPCS